MVAQSSRRDLDCEEKITWRPFRTFQTHAHPMETRLANRKHRVESEEHVPAALAVARLLCCFSQLRVGDAYSTWPLHLDHKGVLVRLAVEADATHHGQGHRGPHLSHDCQETAVNDRQGAIRVDAGPSSQQRVVQFYMTRHARHSMLRQRTQ